MWMIKKKKKKLATFFNGNNFGKGNFVDILWNWKPDKNKQNSSVKIVDILKQAFILKKIFNDRFPN